VYTLYIGNKNYSSWSLRPWVLLSVLGIPFREELVPFEKEGSWEKFRTFSPTGLVPCLHDQGEAGERVVWESLGIVEYIAEQSPEVWPRDADARAWARSAAAEMHAGFHALRNECPMTVGLRIRLHEISAELQANLRRLRELWEEGLGVFGGAFLAGPDFSAVDAFFAPVAFRLQTYGLTLSGDCDAYAQRILQLPAMRAWAREALDETFRHESHEEELRALGDWLEDLRA
jgi:glutathione S-transferase